MEDMELIFLEQEKQEAYFNQRLKQCLECQYFMHGICYYSDDGHGGCVKDVI